MSRAGLDKNPRDVAEMFDGVAEGYDRTNSVMTLGFDRRWRWLTRSAGGRAGRTHPRPRRRHRGVHGRVREVRRVVCGRRLLAGHAPQRRAPRRAEGRRRRVPPAVRRRLVRRGHRVLRAAQHERHGRRAARDVPGRAPGRPAGDLRGVAAAVPADPLAALQRGAAPAAEDHAARSPRTRPRTPTWPSRCATGTTSMRWPC